MVIAINMPHWHCQLQNTFFIVSVWISFDLNYADKICRGSSVLHACTGNHLFPKILDLCAKFLTHKHIWSSYMNSLQEWNKREAKVNFISWMGNHSSAERKKTTGNKKWTTFSKWNLETKKWCQWTLIFSYFSEMALKLFASEKKHILK